MTIEELKKLRKVSREDMIKYYEEIYPYDGNSRRATIFARKLGFSFHKQMKNRKYYYYYVNDGMMPKE